LQVYVFMFCARVAVVFILWAPGAFAYSVLTHEAIIDSAWDQNLKPLLLERYPNAGADDLRMAHAYAYGGAIIQDMGYYPFGSKFFSDLVHYVRSGDFVVTMIRDAQDLDEYAFALGSLAHYAADNEGHRIAVNPAVAMEYPKLREKFGPEVTYEDNPSAHLKVEFGFDVLQVARGHYGSQEYHDFIGFQVSKPLLERAFRDTYGIELTDVFGDLDLALGTYRHTVSGVIPEMTKVAWDLKKNDLVRERPGLTRRRFLYNISRASYEKEWDRHYERPGVGARILAFFFRILPKVGPLRALAFKPPTTQTVTLFEQSFNATLAVYRELLARAGQGKLEIENRDFDTGAPTRPGDYKLADDAYSKLAIKLAAKDTAQLDPKIVANVLGYFRDLDQPYATKRNHKQWDQTVAAVGKLRMLPAMPRNPAAETRLAP
jgi:Zinc dependent phospholipase C